MRKVCIVGTGPGFPAYTAALGIDAVRGADVVVGSRRLLEAFSEELRGGALGARRFAAVNSDRIVEALTGDDTWLRAVVLMGGDTGLYSGTSSLLKRISRLGDIDIEVIPGISSASALAALLQEPWQDWRIASAHGQDLDVVSEAARGGKLFLLTSGANDPGRFCEQLSEAGLGSVPVVVAERLSYPDEWVSRSTAAELAGLVFDPLNVLLFDFGEVVASDAGSTLALRRGGACAGSSTGEDSCKPDDSRVEPTLWPYATGGIPDDLFIRGDVPMTKAEVRAVAHSKLRIAPRDVVWDVGAGTGSVSVEASLAASEGHVFAIERDAGACELVARNAEKFDRPNIEIMQAFADEEYLANALSAPQAVFVGGSGGALAGIVRAALALNPAARICVNCITLETLHEATELLSDERFCAFEVCQVQVSRACRAGGYSLMKAQNPVFIVSAEGRGSFEPDIAGGPRQ